MHAYYFKICTIHTLHQNIPFNVFFFHLCALNSVLWKTLRIWSLIFFPLENMKTARSWFSMYIQGRKCQSSNQERIEKNLLLVKFFFLQDQLFWQRAWYDTMYYVQLSVSKIFFWKMPTTWDTLPCNKCRPNQRDGERFMGINNLLEYLFFKRSAQIGNIWEQLFPYFWQNA